MAHLTDYGENYLIDHLFRTRTLAKPTAWYVALFTAAPSDAGGGTEVSSGSYARVNLAPADANWAATQGGVSGNSSGTGGQTSNAAVVTFPAPSADWGAVTHWGLCDASSGGNLWFAAPLATARVILNGDPPPSFDVAALGISVG